MSNENPVTPVSDHVAADQIDSLLDDRGLIPGSPEEEQALADTATEGDTAYVPVQTAEDEPSPADGEHEADSDAEHGHEDEAEDHAADDDGEEDGDADEDDGEEPEGQGRTFTVTVDGQKFQVPEAELIAGYQRQADYSRKTAALAEDRRQVEAIGQEARQSLQWLHEKMSAFQEPDWNALAAQGVPHAELQQAYSQWQQHAAETAAVAAEVQRVQTAERAQRVQQSHRALMEYVPEWSDHATRLKDLEDIAAYAQGMGWSAEDLAQADDARTIAMALDAVRYRRLMHESANVRSQAVKKGQKVLKPGGAETTNTRSRRAQNDARQRLRRTGSMADAGAVLADYVDV